MNATVGVVIPVKDRKDQLLRAVDSVLSQTYKNISLVIVDDGSQIDFSEIEAYVRVKGHNWIRSSGRGVAAARNCGASLLGNVQYLAFLDSDDEWLPNKLECQMQFLGTNGDYRISQTNEIWIRNGVQLKSSLQHGLAQGFDFARCIERCSIGPSSVVIQRELFREMGGFDEAFVACEDYELWLRISANEKIHLHPEALIRKYAGHSDQLSHQILVLDRLRLFALLKFRCLGLGTREQRVLVDGAIREKISFLASGARRRGSQHVGFFTELETSDFAAISLGDVASILLNDAAWK
jgi:glycosyltransferase involved in cell wall biosynthesis